ncbi:MAG: hypothetical protein AAF927_05690 [Bacteroidota bacterium]
MKTTSFPLQHLLIRLEQAGFQIDPARQMRIQSVLLQLGSQYRDNPHGLSQLLTPLVAQNEEEQTLVTQIIAEYLEESMGQEETASAERSTPTTEIGQSLKEKRRNAYLIALAVIVVISAIWKMRQNTQPHELDIMSFLQSSTAHDKFKQDSSLPKIDERLAGDPSLKEYPLLNEVRFVTKAISNAGEPGLFFIGKKSINHPKTQLLWRFFKDGHLVEEKIGDQVRFTNEQLGDYEVEVEMSYLHGPPEIKASNRSSFLLLPPEISANERASQLLALQEKEQNFIKIGLFFFCVFLIVLIEGLIRIWEKQAYRLYFQREFLEDAAGEYALPHADNQIKLEAEPAFYDLAESMSHRQSGQLATLDIPQTLYATVRNGGLPSLKYKSQQVDTEYLVLIDESEPNRPAAALFAQLVKLLQAESVAIRAYTFRNDPRDCYNDKGDPWELDSLARKYAKHRLLVFAKGSYLVEPGSNKLATWVNQAFAAWETKVLISPEPRQNWHKREEALSLCFSLVPADMQGQLGLVEALQSSGLSIDEKLHEVKLVQQKAHVSLAQYDLNQADDLEAYLDEASFQWLTALSLAPGLRWEMILKVGEAMQADQLVEEKWMSYDKLMKLSQLPFVQAGEMPQSLRAQLAQRMDQETEAKARQAILSVLAEKAQGAPNLENKVQQTVQKAALEPENKDLQAKMKFLFHQGWLAQYHQADWANAFQMPWYERVPVFSLASGVALIVMLSFGLSDIIRETPNYSNQRLIAKHLRSSTVGLGQGGRGLHSIAELKAQIKHFEDFNDPIHLQAGEWMQALDALDTAFDHDGSKVLKEIIKQPNHRYYFEATMLQKDLNSVYRWFQ